MLDRIIFKDANSLINKIFEKEKIVFDPRFMGNLLRIISKFSTYEEEENRILPTIIVGCNIDDLFKSMPEIKFIQIKECKEEGDEIGIILKSIFPFCNNGWIAYIDKCSDSLSYGVLRAFNNVGSLSIKEHIFDDEHNLSLFPDDIQGMVYISALSKSEVLLKGLRTPGWIIDTSFTDDDEKEYVEDCLDEFSDDILRNYNGEYKEQIKNSLLQLFRLALQKVHGTICVVVKHGVDMSTMDFIGTDLLLLPKPINIHEYIVNAVQNNDATTASAYYGISSLFLEMMNIDGITIVDTKGNILAYNAFVKIEGESLHGGARRRAAKYIIDHSSNDVVGVYFQSQDGNIFYKRKRTDE